MQMRNARRWQSAIALATIILVSGCAGSKREAQIPIQVLGSAPPLLLAQECFQRAPELPPLKAPRPAPRNEKEAFPTLVMMNADLRADYGSLADIHDQCVASALAATR